MKYTRKHTIVFFISILVIANIITFLIARSCCNEAANAVRSGNDTIDQKTEEYVQSAKSTIPDSIKEKFKPKKFPYQHYEIETSNTSFITTQKGSKFVFPEGCFLNKDNIPIKNKKVKIQIIEVTDVEGLVKMDIPTITEDGSLLESGGCYYMNATSDGKKVTINPQKPVMAKLKNHSDKPDMDFFKGLGKEKEVDAWKKIDMKVDSVRVCKYFNMYRYDQLKNYLNDNIYNEDIQYIKKKIDLGGKEPILFYAPKEDLTYQQFVKRHDYTYCNDTFKRVSEENKDIYSDFRFYRVSLVNKRKKEYLKLKTEKKEWDDFMSQNKYRKIYRLTINGTWYNLDKFLDRSFMTYKGTVKTSETYVRVHLVSLNIKFHRSIIIRKDGQFTFRFLRNEPFTIIVHTPDGKAKEKSFDGSKKELGTVKL